MTLIPPGEYLDGTAAERAHLHLLLACFRASPPPMRLPGVTGHPLLQVLDAGTIDPEVFSTGYAIMAARYEQLGIRVLLPLERVWAGVTPLTDVTVLRRFARALAIPPGELCPSSASVSPLCIRAVRTTTPGLRTTGSSVPPTHTSDRDQSQAERNARVRQRTRAHSGSTFLTKEHMEVECRLSSVARFLRRLVGGAFSPGPATSRPLSPSKSPDGCRCTCS